MKWEFKAQADGAEADIYINDFIGDWIDDYWGFGVTSRAFLKQLQDLPESVKTIRLHLNTPGGDVVAATHIANLIRDQREHKGRTFEVLIEGAAWSAGTIITSAGQPTKMADNALMFVHDPWTRVTGNARELRKAAEASDKFRDAIVATYRWKSSLEPEDLIDLMANDTWMDADEALAKGFIDEKIEGVTASALFDASQLPKLDSVPEKYRARVKALLKPSDPPATPPSAAPVPASQPADPPVEDPSVIRSEAAAIVSLCTEHGLSEMAAEFLAKGTRLAAVQKRFSHAGEIKNRCVAAGMPERAGRFIAADMTPEEVAAALIKIKQATDPGEIDNKNRSEGTAPKSQPVIDSKEIYARRRPGHARASATTH